MSITRAEKELDDLYDYVMHDAHDKKSAENTLRLMNSIMKDNNLFSAYSYKIEYLQICIEEKFK